MNLHRISLFKSLALVILAAAALTACTGTPQNPPSSGSGDKAKEPVRVGFATSGDLSEKQPLVIDEATRTVRILAHVNGKYLHEPTRHGVNYVDGTVGAQALFNTPASQFDFYDALMKLQAKPGRNLTMESKGEHIDGEPLQVTVTWDGAGKEYDINEVVLDSTGKKIEYRFGGNEENAKKALTGCFLCFDSCPVGMASSTTHAMGAFASKEVEFRGNKDVLPADGTPVIVTVKIKG